MLKTHLAIQMALFVGLCASPVTHDKQQDAYHFPHETCQSSIDLYQDGYIKQECLQLCGSLVHMFTGLGQLAFFSCKFCQQLGCHHLYCCSHWPATRHLNQSVWSRAKANQSPQPQHFVVVPRLKLGGMEYSSKKKSPYYKQSSRFKNIRT